MLGSSRIEMWLNEHGRGQKVVFSGDLGRYNTPILNDPAVITSADHVVIGSTCGDRRHHDRQQTLDEIGELISKARQERGNLLIPAFSIGRTRQILSCMGLYCEEWELDRREVFPDSPMAIKACKIYRECPHLHDTEATLPAAQDQ